jgi:hypothetical protein
MGFFNNLRPRRRHRRRPADPMKQVGNAAGKAIAGVIVAGLMSMFRKK